MLRSIKCWSDQSDFTLQDCFNHVDWDVFRVALDNNIDVYAALVSKLIRKCIGDVVPTVTIKTVPNQKPWIDGSIHAKLKARTIAFNHGKATGNTNSVVIPSLRQSNKHSVSRHLSRVAIQRLKHEMYVTGSTENHGLQKENQPCCGHRCLASRPNKQLLCML